MFAPILAPFLFLLAPPQNQLPEHLRPGVALFQQQKLDEAIAAFDQLLREDPEDGQAWYYYGLALHGAGDYDQAIRGHLMASLLIAPGHPFKTNATYNIACAYALIEQPERSIQWLHRARNSGFSNFQLVKSDSDFGSLREDARFQAFLTGGAIPSPAPASAHVVSMTETLAGSTGGVEIAADGVLYVADFAGRVYRIQQDGAAEVLATGFVKAADCTLDADGNLLQVDHGGARVWRISPDGAKVDLGVKGIVAPVGIDTEVDGSFYLTDYRVNSIVHVKDGETTTLAAGGLLNGPNGLANAGERGLFVVNYNDGAVLRVDPETGTVAFVAELPGGGNGHVAWSGDALYVTGRKAHKIFRVTPEGSIRVIAGSGRKGPLDGDAATCRFNLPNGIALSSDGGHLFTNDVVTPKTYVMRRITIEGV